MRCMLLKWLFVLCQVFTLRKFNLPPIIFVSRYFLACGLLNFHIYGMGVFLCVRACVCLWRNERDRFFFFIHSKYATHNLFELNRKLLPPLASSDSLHSLNIDIHKVKFNVPWFPFLPHCYGDKSSHVLRNAISVYG